MTHGNASTPTPNIVDCLAAGRWGTYKRKFPGDAAFPSDCGAKLWLHCNDDDDDGAAPESHHGAHTWRFGARRLLSAADEAAAPEALPAAPAASPPRRLRLRDFLRKHHMDEAARAVAAGARLKKEVDAEKAAVEAEIENRTEARERLEQLEAPYQVRAARPMEGVAAMPAMFAAAGRPGAASPFGESPGEPPADVFGTCSPLIDGMEKFHVIAEVAPSVGPQIAALLVFKAVFTVVATVLTCMGFCWGKELHAQIQSRPHIIMAPPQVMLQPALGSALVAQPVDGMQQPLMT